MTNARYRAAPVPFLQVSCTAVKNAGANTQTPMNKASNVHASMPNARLPGQAVV
ncbi:MAG TPA: hypothetical protein VFF81_11270 [Noviherbaspirillum sp.]|nr:hypothetical protein [Noviherbaspirillum sp.]